MYNHKEKEWVPKKKKINYPSLFDANKQTSYRTKLQVSLANVP